MFFWILDQKAGSLKMNPLVRREKPEQYIAGKENKENHVSQPEALSTALPQPKGCHFEERNPFLTGAGPMSMWHSHGRL